MEPNEWNDGDPDDPDATKDLNRPFPPAPLPAHERTWRHPSELGTTTVHIVSAPQPAMSRKATVAAVAVGVLLVAGAVRLMTPGGSPSVDAGGTGGAALSVAPTSRLASAPITSGVLQPTTLVAEATATSAVEVTLRAIATLATEITSATPMTIDVEQFGTIGGETAAYALVLGSGYLATTASAVDGLDTVEVHLPSGETVEAHVLRADGPVALLDLDGDGTTAGVHGEPPEPGATVMVGTPAGTAMAMIGGPNDAGYPQLMSDGPLHDSGPVYDDGGALVGMCTRGHDETSWLVPVELLDQMAADQPGDVSPTETTSSAAPDVPETAVASTIGPPHTSTTATAVVTTAPAPSTSASPPTAVRPTTTLRPTTSVATSGPVTTAP